MKICWDTLEKAIYDKKIQGFVIGRNVYYEKDSCSNCGDPFLSRNGENKSCNLSCARAGKNNPRYGIPVSIETRQKMRDNHADISGENHPLYGIGHSLETKQKMKDNQQKESHPRWKGGYHNKKIPLYDTYAYKLEPMEECRRNPDDYNILQVRCTHCRSWFTSTVPIVRHRIGGLEVDKHKFYCSDPCKEVCPIYGKTAKTLMKQDAIKAGRITLKELRNEVPVWIKKKVLELDNHTCQMCGSKDELQVHHEIPQKRNQMLALDIENCLTFCQECHKWVHMNMDGCGYQELANLEVC